MKKFIVLLSCLFLLLAPSAFAADGDPILLPGSASITTVGTISTGTWAGTTITADHGGTGAATLTDGGVLLGSGTDAITPMAVLADGYIIVGDGATDPVALAAFTSSTGTAKHEVGGLEADVSAWTTGVPMISAGATSMLTFYDEDAMTSNSATGLASQQSIKAYVDASVSAPSWGAIASKTVATGVITTGGSLLMAISGEGDVADEVTSVTGAAVGDVIILKGKAALAYTITFVDGGTLYLQANFLMDNADDCLVLLCTAAPATFLEISRASNG
jgi:hypothetical protein